MVAKEKELLESEIEIAREVQSQLFPREIPEMRTLRVKAVCQPARLVSGDYYDYEMVGGTQVALAIADVAKMNRPCSWPRSKVPCGPSCRTTWFPPAETAATTRGFPLAPGIKSQPATVLDHGARKICDLLHGDLRRANFYVHLYQCRSPASAAGPRRVRQNP